MARRNQMDDFMVGGSRGPSANRPDPNAGRRPGDPYIIAQDSRPVGYEGLSQNEIQQFNDFLNVSGRGDKIRNRTNISGRDAAKLARMQFDQFRNLQGGGDYAPSLKPGMKVPGGTIQRVPQEGGIAGFLGRGGFLGNFLGDIGGNAPRTIRPVDSGPSGRRGRGSFNLNTGQVRPTLSDDQIFDSLIKRATTVADANIPVGGIMNNIAQGAPELIETNIPGTNFVSQSFDYPGTSRDLITARPANTIVEETSAPAAAQPASTVDTMSDFDRAMSDRLAIQAAAQDAADASELQMIELLQRGRELADRDARNQALQQSVGQAVASAQIRDAERAAALDAVNQAALEESRRQAALEALFTEAGLENMAGDGPVFELPPVTDPIDDFDTLTLGTTPLPTAPAPAPGPMGISLDGYGRPIMDFMSPTEEAYMRMTEADDVGVYMDPSAQTSEQQLRPYDRGGVPGTGEGITIRPSDALGAVSGMAPPSSFGPYREFNREGMPYVSRRALNTREDLGRMMDEMMNRRLGYAPNIAQGI